MSLANVLSTVRALILDERTLPSSYQERLAYLNERYPELSNSEREDLAKITPQRLALYTDSIFAGERNVLQGKFPIAFALLRRIWLQQRLEFSGYDLARKLHDKFPWRSGRVGDLVENFARFLTDSYAQLELDNPGFFDVVELERLSFAIPRAENDHLTVGDSLNLEEFPEMTIEQLLELQFLIPHFVQFGSFKFRAPALFRYYKQEAKLPPGAAPEAGECWAIAGRNRNYNTRWVDLSEPVFNYLNEAKRSTLLNLSDLAESYVTASSISTDEEKVLSFVSLVKELSASGAILLTKST